MSHKEISMKELRTNLTELTRDLDDSTILVLTNHKIPLAIIHKIPADQRDTYRKILDDAAKNTESTNPSQNARKPARKTRKASESS